MEKPEKIKKTIEVTFRVTVESTNEAGIDAAINEVKRLRIRTDEQWSKGYGNVPEHSLKVIRGNPKINNA